MTESKSKILTSERLDVITEELQKHPSEIVSHYQSAAVVAESISEGKEPALWTLWLHYRFK